MGILELKNISFAVQRETIVRGVSLEFEEGKTTALVGPSGCGKSTLLKISAGLLLPSGGDVYYKGRNIALMNRAQNLEFRRESAFVFQDSALWANQSLYQSLELPLLIHYPDLTRKDRKRRIEEVIAEVGYNRSLDIRPAALSMGEQKLIAFARAVLCRPALMFLDEWTESLDDKAANRLLSLVKERRLDNNTIIFVSHNLDIIKNLAQTVILLAGGSVHMRLGSEQLAEDSELAALVERGIAE
ncbi:MAG: ABC transporter ATP-binding protein [Treponema sp.]|jgi:ABC-type lipoprotein export system ATPase subunit|nr:ABC transporter ATP-binding protein [Treponema sp.]